MLSHAPPPGAPKGEQPSGGKSLLVDGFYAAEQFREQNEQSPELLSALLKPIPWHASGNQGTTIKPDTNYPVIVATGFRVGMPGYGTIHQIRWNNDDRASKQHSIHRCFPPPTLLGARARRCAFW